MKLLNPQSLILVFFLVSIFFSCTPEEESIIASCNVDTTNIELDDLPCDDPIIIDLIAGQTIPVGSISILYDGTNLMVTYTTTGGWVLDETHVFAGYCGDIPLTPAPGCNPQIGLFPFQADHNPSVTSYTYTISTIDFESCFCLITHAAVSKPGTTNEETAFGNGGNEFPGNRWGWFGVYCPESCDTINDDSCSTEIGAYRSQTQGGWGAVPNGNNPGVYLHDNFTGAFPNGLVAGCDNTITLTSAQAVTDFLPQGGGPVAITMDYVDPTDPLISTLAGNLIAVMLAVGFDDYDSTFGTSALAFGDLVVTQGDFAGWTINQVVEEANKALGGCPTTYSLSALNDTLSAISQAFVDGTTSTGYVACP